MRSRHAAMWRLLAGRGACLALTVVMVGSWMYPARALDEGKPLPPLVMQDLVGKSIDVAGLRGKVVLVDFWASWCEPCKEEMPVLEELHRTYQAQGLKVVAVSVDNKLENVRSFLRSHPVSFTVVHDAKHEVSKRFKPPTMPTSYLIDRSGVVRHVHRGFRSGDASRIEARIKSLLDR